MNEKQNKTPVKVYRSPERLTVATPFPGLEPQDIIVHVTDGGELIMEGRPRGVFKGDKEVLRDEWNPGPYFCRIDLDSPVDGTMANVTYENGVLVVALPISAQTMPAELSLERLARTEGKRYGNAGHPVQAMSLEQHYQLRVRLEEATSAGINIQPF